jgi:hypothetical protein
MYNQYNKNKTDDLGGQKSEEVGDFYIPIGAILVELDCPNNLARIESNNSHIIGPDSNNRISVYAIEVIMTLEKTTQGYAVGFGQARKDSVYPGGQS